MKVLSVNAGSSSLKFEMYEMPEEKSIIKGIVAEIATGRSFYTLRFDNQKVEFQKDIKDHGEAVDVVLKELVDRKFIASVDDIKAIGHRVVHGGELYSESTIIDDELINNVEALSDLAPLHNPANITGIKAFRKYLPNAIDVAVFDTAFHQTMEKCAYMYALPYEWYEKYGVRKYGFHGTSHRYITQRVKEIFKRDDVNVISCHLGNGGSLCAIRDGKSIDTTMGFTPLPGVMMGTRPGDFDPSIIEFIMKKENKTIGEVMTVLNKESGFLGVSGLSSDSRVVEKAVIEGNERAILAEDIFARRVVQYIGAYAAELGHVDMIVFTAGLGENNPVMRSRVLKQLEFLGVKLDEEANNSRGKEVMISSNEVGPKCYVIPTNEELMIARDAYSLVK